MNCPRCAVRQGEAGPYRGASAPERPPLVSEAHTSGIKVDRCARCGGVYLDHGELGAIESFDRDNRIHEAPAIDFLRRAYEQAKRPTSNDQEDAVVALDCPACGEVMFEREWSIGTLVRVDVCLDCRGVWLDSGELEALEGLFGRK